MTADIPAGWYPQPDGSQRYWDGNSWTEHVSPPPPPAAQPPTQPISAYADPPRPAYGPPQGVPGQMVPVQQGQMMVAPKNPAVSLLASFFLPGLGSMINGEVGKGVGILIGYLVSFVLLFVFIGIIGIFVFWIWGMVDGYQGAQRWNAKHGILS